MLSKSDGEARLAEKEKEDNESKDDQELVSSSVTAVETEAFG